jgi:hypothetical protein
VPRTPRRVEAFGQRGGLTILTPGLLVTAVPVGLATALAPRTVAAAGLGIALLVCVFRRPALAGYLVVGTTPLIAGIDRGQAVPFLRPSEAVALLAGMALAARGIPGLRTGALPRLTLNRIEIAVLMMAVCNSIVPLLWMLAHQQPISRDDILYALVLWKYLGVYVIIRVSIKTDQQILRCLWVAVSSAMVVAAVAILQARELFGVPQLLSTYYSPFGYSNLLHNSRGSSTLALPAATADLLVFCVAIVSGLWLLSRQHRLVLGIAAGLFVVGALSAGEFSSAIGLVIAVCCIAMVTSYPRLLSLFVPAGALGMVILRPVIERRLSGFDSVSGLPISWTGRLENLRGYFWPTLFSHGNFVFGVRPSARVPVSSQGTGYVWIESGYTWLLWGGGIPLLLSFIYFVHVVGSTSWRVARADRSPAAVAGLATFVAIAVITVLMTFDPHLTYRGAAEQFFALLAITGIPGRRKSQDSTLETSSAMEVAP